MKEITCIFCKIESVQTVIKENGFEGKRCSQCGLIYISPRPSFEEITDLYGHDSAHIKADEHISDEYRKRLYARHHLAKLKKFISEGTLLEIGSGAGFFLDEARKCGFDPYGLEFNPGQIEFMRNKLNIPCEDKPLNINIFGGKKFDIIYHCDVISHLYSPFADFHMMNRLLNENGILFFETGNFAEMEPSYYPYIPTFMYPDHLFFFNLNNLKALLDETGFELVYMKRYSIFPQLWLKSKIGGNEKLYNDAYQDQNDQPHSKRFVEKVKVWVNYLMRYYLGAVTPKPGRPQTLLICARKRN